ncbi:kinase-like protein [Mytilinidion resinicola]|uniref:EKC/KEOPS complex subunit BUD32 n=1 Tax=Mytilinidion resinicola TaxID=574789 RepID=A0A6A6YF15_9PEZI|nr:kinase-like protein [Mytilinidion resinicola]KAF2807381.1 kinase-like protein [Mytilinidion resinicola]
MPDFKKLARIFSPRATEIEDNDGPSRFLPLPSVTPTTFSSSYSLLRRLKEGESGDISLYTHQTSLQSIVVKPVKSVHPKQPLEYSILEICKHCTNIVTVLGLCANVPNSNTDAILLEYCKHGDLLEYQNLFVDNSVYPTERTMRVVFRQLLQALAFLHNGVGSGTDTTRWKPIVHRDIRLENVLVSKLDEGAEGSLRDIVEIKLTDFDLAKRYNKKDCTVQRGAGSPVCWPPEQTLQKRQAKPRGDVWAVGAVIHALVHCTYPLKDVVEYNEQFLRNYAGRYPAEIGEEERDNTLRERWYWEALVPREVTPFMNAIDGYDGSGARVDRNLPLWQLRVAE